MRRRATRLRWWAWTAIRWVVGGIVLFAAVVGLLFLTRGTAVRRLREDGASAIAPGEPTFLGAIALVTETALTDGNDVTLAPNGDGTFARLWADLRGARRDITVQVYDVRPSRVADTLTVILAERARAGVRVYFLYDAFGSRVEDARLVALRTAGVRVEPFRPFRFENLWVLQNRLHVRGIVVDGRVGWTGGFGFDDKWLGGGRQPHEWRETNVRVEGPAARQLQAAFVAGWAEATGSLLTGHASGRPAADGGTRAGLLHTAPTLGSTAAARFLALSIASARDRLWMTNAYFAPDESFVRMLARAARRGVDVRILVGGPRTEIRAARLAAHVRYEPLLAAGVRIWEYQPTTLHAKTFVIDGQWVAVGTMNIDNRSLALNDEATLMILDRDVGRRMEDMFLADLRASREVDLATFRRRPWTARFAEWAASQVTPLL